MTNIKAIFLPGNGGGDTNTNFFPYIKIELEKLGITVISPGVFPDPEIGRQSVWIPYIQSLGADENTILIGHSTGAIAAMKYAEDHALLGSILIAPYYTHMNMQSEKDAEYFDTAWNWDAIKKNQKWIIQFNSLTDPHIPIDEARHVHEHLQTDYHELSDGGHFYPQEKFPEIIEAIKKFL